jgi:hypothetical protein
MQNYRAISVILAAVTALTLGCSERIETRFTCNATGVVKVAGQPTAGVYIYLDKIGNAQSSALGAKSDANGAFSVPLAAPGEYVITAVWPKVAVDHGEEIEGEDRFQGKYADPLKPVLKATIREGDNSLPPIELKR